jgi:hypothetical protein
LLQKEVFYHCTLTPLAKTKKKKTFDFLYKLVPQKTCFIALESCVKEARSKEWQKGFDSGNKFFLNIGILHLKHKLKNNISIFNFFV